MDASRQRVRARPSADPVPDLISFDLNYVLTEASPRRLSSFPIPIRECSASGIGHQASGIGHQASGKRHRAQGSPLEIRPHRPLICHRCEQILHNTVTRHQRRGPCLCQRCQDEASFGQPRMRHPQSLSFDHSVPIEEDVEIDFSGAPSLLALSSRAALDVETRLQQRSGTAHRVENDHRVEIVGLVRSDRRRLPDRGTRDDGALTAKGRNRGAQLIVALPDVGTQADSDSRLRLPPLRG